jgi:hypothetical protein
MSKKSNTFVLQVEGTAIVTKLTNRAKLLKHSRTCIKASMDPWLLPGRGDQSDLRIERTVPRGDLKGVRD